MARIYTFEQKLTALRRLDDNGGDAELTSMEMGIPKRTLQEWRRKNNPRRHPFYDMRRLRTRLLRQAIELASNLNSSVEQSSFNQRAEALNQIVDKILKITEILEKDGNYATQIQEPVLRVEFMDEQGEVRQTPYRSDDDSDE